MKMFPVPCFNRVEKIEKEDKIISHNNYSITISGKIDEYGNVEIFKPFDVNIQDVYTSTSNGTITNYSYYNTVGVDSANWAE